MYYIIGDGHIIEFYDSYNGPDQDYLKQLADDCDLDELWVIRGEHSGITYERPKAEPEPKHKPRLVFGEPMPPELNPRVAQPRIKGL
ncbi:MAG: hypothetical protein ACYTGS_04095 [Planctomycetota bacterium]